MSGFTVVELLIVIVVIALLAAVSVLAYNGTQQRANNAARVVVGKQWADLFEIYKGTFGKYPSQISPPGTGFCLGSGFPQGLNNEQRCKSYKSGGMYATPSPRGSQPESLLQSNNAALMTELRKAGSLPESLPLPSRSKQLVGPYVDYNRYTLAPAVAIAVDGVVPFGNDCGGGFISDYVDSTNNLTACLLTLPD